MAGSLLETVVAISLQALVMTLMTSSLISAATVSRLASDVDSRMLRSRRVEQLLDATTVPLGRGLRPHQALTVADPHRVVIEADLDGNGYIDIRSRERSAFEIAASPLRLVHRIGRQAMSIGKLGGSSTRFLYYDQRGLATTDPTAVWLMVVPTAEFPLYAALEHTRP